MINNFNLQRKELNKKLQTSKIKLTTVYNTIINALFNWEIMCNFQTFNQRITVSLWNLMNKKEKEISQTK